MKLRTCLPFCTVAVLGWPGAAWGAGGVPIRIELEAPAGCASADDFYAALRARAEEVRLGQAGERAIEVVVKLEPGSDVLHGELRVIDEHGDMESRKVDGSSCEAVVEALSLTAALAFEAAQGRKQAAPEPASLRSETATPRPLEPVEEAPNTEPSAAPHFSLEVGAVLTRVLTDQTGLGAVLSGRVRWESQHGSRASLGPSLGLALDYASSGPLESTGSVSSSWTAAVLTGCPVWAQLGALEVAPCLMASGGVLAVSGLDVENPRSVKKSWWSVGALLSASAPVSSALALELGAGVSAPLVERTFVTVPSETLVSGTPRFSPLGSLGLSYKF